MQDLLYSQLFIVAVAISFYLLAIKIYSLKNFVFFNPIILAPLSVAVFLKLTNIDYDHFYNYTSFISFLLGPATVALAIPLYKQLDTIKKYFQPIAVGVFLGSFTGVLSVIGLVYILGGSELTAISLAAKSATMPIAVAVTEKLDGVVSLVILAVTVSGILGGLIGPEVLRLARVKDKVAIGLAIGTASHAGGTARAIQLGEIEGSLSGSAIILTGALTAAITPLLITIIF